MDKTTTNRIKAFFLLTVFLLNTVAGFACSVGVDMGYNTKHHHKEEKTVGHSHKHGHTHSHKHKHNHAHQYAGAKIRTANDDCCANQVTSFTQLEKLVPASNFSIHPPVQIEAQAPAYYLVDSFSDLEASNSRFQFVRRSCFFNDIDIRIAIQSFQI